MRRPEVMAAAMVTLVTGFASTPNAAAQTAAAPTASAATAAPSPMPPAASPTPVSTPAPPTTRPAVAIESADSAPNRAVIGTGLLAAALWYVPGVIVAARSPVATDASLFVPIAGPWLDLSDRPQCGPGNVSCRVETGNQVLLVMDGLFQAWGLTTAIVGVFLKEHSRAPSSVSVVPARIGRRGYGVAAFATF